MRFLNLNEGLFSGRKINSTCVLRHYFFLMIAPMFPFILFWILPAALFCHAVLKKNLKDCSDNAEKFRINLILNHHSFILSSLVFFMVFPVLGMMVFSGIFEGESYLAVYFVSVVIFYTKMFNGVHAVYKNKPVKNPLNPFSLGLSD